MWNTAEFDVYGDAGSDAANFRAKTTLGAQTTLVGTSLSAPACVKEGFTAETNNLNLTGTPKLGTEASPTVATDQSGGTATTATCVAASGTLTGVDEVVSDVKAIVPSRSGGVNCWGFGPNGELGNRKFYNAADDGSAVPVQVEGVGGTGTLTGVTSLTGDGSNNGSCARLGSGGVDCWGSGADGQLGDGTFYTTGDDGSAVPVKVE